MDYAMHMQHAFVAQQMQYNMQVNQWQMGMQWPNESATHADSGPPASSRGTERGGRHRQAKREPRLEPLLGYWEDQDRNKYAVTWDQAPRPGGRLGLTVATTRPGGSVQRTPGLVYLDDKPNPFGGRPLVLWGTKGQYYLDPKELPDRVSWYDRRSLEAQEASRHLAGRPSRPAFVWTRSRAGKEARTPPRA